MAARVASPNGSRPCQPTVHSPKENLSSGVGSGISMVTMAPSVVGWVGSGPGLGAVAQLGVPLPDLGLGVGLEQLRTARSARSVARACRRVPTRPGARHRGRRTPPAAARRQDGPGSAGASARTAALRAAPPTSSTRPPSLGHLHGEQVDGVGERAEQRLVRRPGEVGAGRGRPQPGPGAGGPGPVGRALAAVVGQQGEPVRAGRCAQGEGGELLVVDAEQARPGGRGCRAAFIVVTIGR